MKKLVVATGLIALSISTINCGGGGEFNSLVS